MDMLRTLFCQAGDVAQLGERGVRNAEARGSIPLISTKTSSNVIQRNAKTRMYSGFFVCRSPWRGEQ